MDDRLDCIKPALRAKIAAARGVEGSLVSHPVKFRRNVAEHAEFGRLVGNLSLKELRSAQRGLLPVGGEDTLNSSTQELEEGASMAEEDDSGDSIGCPGDQVVEYFDLYATHGVEVGAQTEQRQSDTGTQACGTLLCWMPLDALLDAARRSTAAMAHCSADIEASRLGRSGTQPGYRGGGGGRV